MIPSSDQDMDDVTLGKLLTEAHRGQADYCEPEDMYVSLSSSVVFDGSGQLDGERMVDGSGKLDERDSSNAQITTLLEERRHDYLGISRKSQSSRTPCSSRRRRAPTPDRNWNFVKLINKVSQKWRNYGNSRVLLSIRSRDENSSRTRTLCAEFNRLPPKLTHLVTATGSSVIRDRDVWGGELAERIGAVHSGDPVPRALHQQRWSPLNVPLMWAAGDDLTTPVLECREQFQCRRICQFSRWGQCSCGRGS